MDAIKDTRMAHTIPLGARAVETGVQFRVWAPKVHRIEVVFGSGDTRSLRRDDETGYFTAIISDVSPGMTYRYRVDGKADFPDPCSRFQPEGPHGPSHIVDPSAYRWRDREWPGVHMAGQVIYELHIGAFTEESTFDAAIRELDALKRLGITLLEVMPITEFPGRWNWGYDGVCLFAPSHMYGDYDALKRFVDAAHGTGLGVILDVVYNHFGPDGNYTSVFSDDYVTDRYPNEWGQALNFDGPRSEGMREFVVQNACYWIEEFHLDGLRIDATHAIHDVSDYHILGELSVQARRAAGRRTIVLIAENESQDIRAVRPVEQGGWGLDAIWCEDFHHVSRVAATGRSEAYYTDYRGTPQEFLSAIKRGFLYQGQRYHWQRKARGTVVDREPAGSFVFYIQNHDQIGNALTGNRLHALTSPGKYRVLTAIHLLAPQTPMLFMGQEYGASNPFLYFVDFGSHELGPKVRQGRQEFLSQFPSYASDEARKAMFDPNDPMTFERSKLDRAERSVHGPLYRLHRDLLRLRREDPVFSAQSREHIDGAVLNAHAFVLRYFEDTGYDRLVVVNLGADLDFVPAPEPLLAPRPDGYWALLWSSDHPQYGGPGIVNPLTDTGWHIPAESATVFRIERNVAALLHGRTQ
ncbi:MAG: malto-oligosyltrehalose trehalohydrolase [Nitrospira sp.]|jgi:maltooligosyltrehalose trehalohydrolase|nr:MAG: malto-oligosyltrehalose trehalohydrolase [Nitrospira sp.]